MSVSDAGIFDIGNPEHRAFIPQGTFLLAYRGSIAHNMYVPDSDPNSIDDVDLMGSSWVSPHYWGFTSGRAVAQRNQRGPV